MEHDMEALVVLFTLVVCMMGSLYVLWRSLGRTTDGTENIIQPAHNLNHHGTLQQQEVPEERNGGFDRDGSHRATIDILSLHVRLGERTIQVDIDNGDPSMTVSRLKSIISQKLDDGTSADGLRIIYHGRFLEDNVHVRDYHLSQGVTLICLPQRGPSHQQEPPPTSTSFQRHTPPSSIPQPPQPQPTRGRDQNRSTFHLEMQQTSIVIRIGGQEISIALQPFLLRFLISLMILSMWCLFFYYGTQVISGFGMVALGVLTVLYVSFIVSRAEDVIVRRTPIRGRG
ncbi:putative ubiquitin-like protein DskB [Planoprotostelium fungivorum]|uniref:Putative ubiquitin-like protein DskB n=1 Tax=Planoprotostelium fungivorum TaxID=1890364 RepID=A0A2P6NJA4_9EUKA|nr:putative ubiquitin-like protein DskB [Planoprotostelium fungivorum]